jgi:hypothetical protein
MTTTGGPRWASNGTLTTGEHTTITATTVHVARGTGATGTINMNGGRFAAEAVHMVAGGAFHFNDGRLAVNNFITPGSTGNLEQHGGSGVSSHERRLPAYDHHGGYQLDSAGVLAIELFGADPAQLHRRSRTIDLDADAQRACWTSAETRRRSARVRDHDSYGHDPSAGFTTGGLAASTNDFGLPVYVSTTPFAQTGNVVLRVMMVAVPARIPPRRPRDGFTEASGVP